MPALSPPANPLPPQKASTGGAAKKANGLIVKAGATPATETPSMLSRRGEKKDAVKTKPHPPSSPQR
jgi:hypothetical protein